MLIRHRKRICVTEYLLLLLCSSGNLPGFRMVRCACFSNSAIRKLPPPMFPVLWYNLAASALAQACKMLCTKNSLIHWPLVLTKLRSQPTAPFFSGCFPSALIHIAFIVALHNSRCVHTRIPSAGGLGLLVPGNTGFISPWSSLLGTAL